MEGGLGAFEGLEVEKVEQALRQMIMTFELEPGTSVTHAYLTKRLGCGKTPLREAIQRLIATGLVVHTRNRGISIAPLDVRQYGYAVDVYTALGAWGVRQAAEMATPEQVACLRELGDRLFRDYQAGNLEAALMVNVRLEHAVFAIVGNPYLIETTDRFGTTAQRFARAYYLRHPDQEPLWESALRIMEAVCRGDADGAEAAFRDGLRRARERVLRGLLG